MKCPYAANRQIITQTNIEYDENREQKSYIEVQNSKVGFIGCIGTECGAYYYGKCHYNG